MDFNDLMMTALTEQAEIAEARAINAATLLGLGGFLAWTQKKQGRENPPALSDELGFRAQLLEAAIASAQVACAQLRDFEYRVSQIHTPEPRDAPHPPRNRARPSPLLRNFR